MSTTNYIGGVSLLKNLLDLVSFNRKLESSTSVSDELVVLQDVSLFGRDRNWRERKELVYLVQESFARLGNDKKADRLSKCANCLTFFVCPEGHEKKLKTAEFCQVRLCPMCSFRRSLIIGNQLRKVAHTAHEERNFRFLFLTLTAKTVGSEDLSGELDKYFKAWGRLSKRTPFKKSVKGWFRALEVTHNMSRDTYHPHFHCLLAVKPYYFKGNGYINHAGWVQLWKESMRLNYNPVVDIRVVRPKQPGGTIEKALVEITKYTVKSGDYLNAYDLEGQDLAIKTLDKALKSRRLIAYGGVLKDIWKELRFQDPEKSDLVKTDDDLPEGCTCSICNAIYEEVAYLWHKGFRNYIATDSNLVEENGKLISANSGAVLLEAPNGQD